MPWSSMPCDVWKLEHSVQGGGDGGGSGGGGEGSGGGGGNDGSGAPLVERGPQSVQSVP